MDKSEKEKKEKKDLGIYVYLVGSLTTSALVWISLLFDLDARDNLAPNLLQPLNCSKKKIKIRPRDSFFSD